MKFTLSVAMADPSHYLPLAIAAENAGYDSVCVPDSIFFSQSVSAAYPYTANGKRGWTADTPFVEPLVAIPAMAAVTSRIRFYTSVLKLAVRNPLLVAKSVSSIAVLSGERVGLGVGLGWLPEEFEWCGTEFSTRGARGNEAIEILRLVLGATEPVSYEGKHYRFGALQLAPVPTTPVPLYVGGHSEPGLKRAARLGDGWCSAMITESQVAGFVGRLSELRKKAGRDHLPFEIQVVCMDVFNADGYRRLEDAGVTDVIVVPWILYGKPINGALTDKVDGLVRFAETVMAGVPRG